MIETPMFAEDACFTQRATISGTASHPSVIRIEKWSQKRTVSNRTHRSVHVTVQPIWVTLQNDKHSSPQLEMKFARVHLSDG